MSSASTRDRARWSQSGNNRRTPEAASDFSSGSKASAWASRKRQYCGALCNSRVCSAASRRAWAAAVFSLSSARTPPPAPTLVARGLQVRPLNSGEIATADGAGIVVHQVGYQQECGKSYPLSHNAPANPRFHDVTRRRVGVGSVVTQLEDLLLAHRGCERLERRLMNRRCCARRGAC